MPAPHTTDNGPNYGPANSVRTYLEAHGWDHKGRDCWCKYEESLTDPRGFPSLVVRWLGAADIAQLRRLRHEARELIYALDAALGIATAPAQTAPTPTTKQPQQGSLI